jgi:hypothetical protein
LRHDDARGPATYHDEVDGRAHNGS